MRIRGALAALFLLALAACASAPFAQWSTGPPRALRILLTNDDGVEAPGIRVLHEALVADGHEVVIVAPSANRSGSSVSITTQGLLEVREVEPDVYAVDGSPADCVLLGIRRIVPEPVDLVVSGINMGQNVGRRMVASGTVGATIAAVSIGVPAVAISQTVDPVDYRNTPRFFPGAASFTAVLVSVLSEHKGRVLPAGVALNVNHPPLLAGDVPGVRLTRQGNSVLYELSYEPTGPGRYRVRFVPSDLRETVPDADTTALARGYISVTPLDGNWGVSKEVWSGFRPLAERLGAAAAAP
jgi:5'-nucleotidase